jgi:hypothetical protein
VGRGRNLAIILAENQKEGRQFPGKSTFLQSLTTNTQTELHKTHVGVSQTRQSQSELNIAQTLQKYLQKKIKEPTKHTHTHKSAGVARTEQQDEQSYVDFITRQSPTRQFPEVRSIDLPIHAARKTAQAGAAQAHTRIYPDLQELLRIPGVYCTDPDRFNNRVGTLATSSRQRAGDISL